MAKAFSFSAFREPAAAKQVVLPTSRRCATPLFDEESSRLSSLKLNSKMGRSGKAGW